MTAPDQDLKDFPWWIWPYIRVADLAKVVRPSEQVGGLGTPSAAVDAHVIQISSAIAARRTALYLKDTNLRQQFESASSMMLNKAIDDCGNGKQRPWPRPPKHIEMLEVAGRLALAAAAISDEFTSGELANAAAVLAERAARG